MMVKKLDMEIAKIICDYVGHRCVLCEENRGIPTKIPEPPWWQYVCVGCADIFFTNSLAAKFPARMNRESVGMSLRSAGSDEAEAAISPRSALSDEAEPVSHTRKYTNVAQLGAVFN